MVINQEAEGSVNSFLLLPTSFSRKDMFNSPFDVKERIRRERLQFQTGSGVKQRLSPDENVSPAADFTARHDLLLDF